MALLFFVALLSLAATAASSLWMTVNLRSKERELLFIGHQFRDAIQKYYEGTPGSIKRYPNNLLELLKDDRHLQLTRSLRRLYLDPMTGRAEWGIVAAPGGGIMGVFSLGQGKPMKQRNFDPEDLGFENVDSYTDWKFIAHPPRASQP